MSLEHIENRHFGVGERIQLDGKYFVDCTFDRCEAIYGGGEISWEGVTKDQPQSKYIHEPWANILALARTSRRSSVR